ncbi:MAG: MotA/TolQ/ExbB proton channel family protein [Methanobrevibacter sp.]|nr:MotA/TolQ/ExbB proton channel family protein [Methanobrevibacter sp.]
MTTYIPGSEILTTILNVISQSLLIPVIVALLIFAIYVIITLGGLITEYTSRVKISTKERKEIMYDISQAENFEDLKEIIEESNLVESQKDILIDIASSQNLGPKSREALARDLIEEQEDKIDKIIEKTDIITRLGPTLGLMGTLIPMGPGLAALGSGDIITLSQAIIVAFDTTVVGIGAGAIGYFISKIRRRWYEAYINNLDALADVVLETISKL